MLRPKYPIETERLRLRFTTPEDLELAEAIQARRGR